MPRKPESTEAQASVTVNLRASSNTKLSEMCKANRQVKKHVISDVIDWYVNIDATTRALVVDDGRHLDPRDLPAIARTVLHRMAVSQSNEGNPADLLDYLGDDKSTHKRGSKDTRPSTSKQRKKGA